MIVYLLDNRHTLPLQLTGIYLYFIKCLYKLSYLFYIDYILYTKMIDCSIFWSFVVRSNTPYFIDLVKCHPSLSKISQETWIKVIQDNTFGSMIYKLLMQS